MGLLKKRSEMHWARKIWHVGGVLSLAGIYYYLPFSWNVVLFGALWLVFILVDFFRLRFPSLNGSLTCLFRSVMRKSEFKTYAGTSYLLTGVLLIVLVFPRDVVFITLLYLALADPMASVVGIRFGKDKIFGRKSLQGSLAAFFVCTLITLAVLSSSDLATHRWLLISFLGGGVGAASEVVPMGGMDDNFSIPVLSALGLSGLFWIFV